MTGYPFADRPVLNYVDGAFVEGDGWFDNVNPVDGSVAGHYDKRIEARFDEFAAAEIADTGKSLHQARTIDIPRGAANFRAFAALAEARAMPSFRTDLADGRSAINYAIARPLGVVAIVSPWNLPLLLMTWKVAPALACGNVVVVKPSEETPSTATLLAEVMDKAGVPPGVFNLVHGFGADSTGEWLTANPDIDAITFTGESATGGAIMRVAAAGVKPVSFELGGKNAALVFADCDFDEAVAGAMRSVFSNCGQVCLCTERIYVERPIFDRFVATLAERAKALTVGDPWSGADMGPLISHGHREKVLSYYALAREEGATVVTGGGVPDLDGALAGGAFVQPTILTGLADDVMALPRRSGRATSVVRTALRHRWRWASSGSTNGSCATFVRPSAV